MIVVKYARQRKNGRKELTEIKEKSSEIFNHIQKIKEKITNLTSSGNPSELLEFINRLSDEMNYLGEELMRQDIRVATATGLIEKRPYPIDYGETERQRLAEVNQEIDNRVNSKNFPH